MNSSTALPLADLRPGERYFLSCPSQPERAAALAARLPGYPLLVVTAEGELAAGHDLRTWLLARDGPAAVAPVWVLPPMPEVDVLLFAYHWRERLGGLNPAEKLLFVQRISGRLSPQELRQRTGLNLPLTASLLDRLDLLLGEPFVGAIAGERITIGNAVSLAGCPEEEAAPLLDLLAAVPFSSGDQRNIIDWARQAARLQSLSVPEVIARIAPPDSRRAEMPKRGIMAALRRLRFPEAAAAEERWHRQVTQLTLPATMELHHAPFFEKGDIELRMRFSSLDQALDDIRRLIPRIPDPEQPPP
ncbi:MAG TPA: hypothetical protein PKK12_08235 [Candidatus Aminicenantes bacterium]|nr:hypothetical protein [Candidatus Aminicenantes bacterium]